MTTSKEYKVFIPDRVKRMLGDHMKFLSRVNKSAANAKRKEIVAAIKSLSHMPERFPLVDERELKLKNRRRMFVPNWYIVIYRIRDDSVYVDYILDCRKDYGSDLS